MTDSSEILNSNILIVDDNPTDILLLEKMLRGAGYDFIASTTDSKQVLELHREHRYDLILLDLLMPEAGFSGYQVMERLKGIEQDGYLPVIVITAHPDHKLRALQAGARDFISKPFELADVLVRVSHMLKVRLLYVATKEYIDLLERQIGEIKACREHIRRQDEEIKRLNDKVRSLEGNDAAVHRPEQVHTLLYMEDKPESLELIRQIIARHPEYHLLTAVNGNLGIEMARASLPEVILTDINLPDISGFQVLETLRADPATAQIPVIALSANAMPLSIEKGLEAGFFRYLTKPIKLDEFIETLNAACRAVVLEHKDEHIG